MVDNEMTTGDQQNEKTYTYREYLARFPRQRRAEHEVGGTPRHERDDPREVGKEMARQIIDRLLSHN